LLLPVGTVRISTIAVNVVGGIGAVPVFITTLARAILTRPFVAFKVTAVALEFLATTNASKCYSCVALLCSLLDGCILTFWRTVLASAPFEPRHGYGEFFAALWASSQNHFGRLCVFPNPSSRSRFALLAFGFLILSPAFCTAVLCFISTVASYLKFLATECAFKCCSFLARLVGTAITAKTPTFPGFRGRNLERLTALFTDKLDIITVFLLRARSHLVATLTRTGYITPHLKAIGARDIFLATNWTHSLYFHSKTIIPHIPRMSNTWDVYYGAQRRAL
jgi:hypothetical protein